MNDIICTAVNYGYFLHAVPGEPPQNVTARNESSTTISVEWESPPQDFLFGILRGYIIRYLPGDMDIVNLTELIPPTMNSFTLENLFEFTNYSIEVTAVTGAGEGPYSSPVYVLTNPDSKLYQLECFYYNSLSLHRQTEFTACQRSLSHTSISFLSS